MGEIDLGAQKAQMVDFTGPRTREERVTQRKSPKEGHWVPLSGALGTDRHVPTRKQPTWGKKRLQELGWIVPEVHAGQE